MVPLPPDAIEMLKRRKLDSTSEYIFKTVTGTKLGGRNLLRHLTAINGHKLHDLGTHIVPGSTGRNQPKSAANNHRSQEN
jgi:integrase